MIRKPSTVLHQHRTAKRRWRRGFTSLCVVVAVALVAAASALAYWTTAGSGAASGAAANAQAVTLSAGTPTAQLYPGGQADVAVDISNPNPFPVPLGSLTLNTGSGTGGFDVDAGHTGCDLSVLSFTTQTNGGAGWSLPARVGATNGVLVLDLSAAVAMGAGAADACQGASFRVHLNAGL
jgi:hypothetical protein